MLIQMFDNRVTFANRIPDIKAENHWSRKRVTHSCRHVSGRAVNRKIRAKTQVALANEIWD